MNVYIYVKNFGKISEAKINISNYTIFVGNNNSGKTQLMELIYGVLAKLATLCPSSFSNIDSEKYIIDDKQIGKIENIINIYLKNNIDEIIQDIFHYSIPIEEIYLEFDEIDVWYEILLVTNNNIDTIINKNLLESDELSNIIQKLDEFYYSIITKYRKSDKMIINHIKQGISARIPYKVAYPILVGSVIGDLIGFSSPIGQNSLYLPASRMGLLLLYKSFFGNNNDNKVEMIRNKYQNNKGVTKPVFDFLSFLLKYNYNDKRAKQNRDVIKFINNNLIDGKINERSDITTYTPKDQKIEIPLFLSSSMINEIAPVMKAITDSDEINYLFYDEVETSLHPLKQIEMVKLLNRLNNKGIKLIISTHSDTMATKINNLLLLSYSDIDFEKYSASLKNNNIAISRDDLLKSSNVHVYQFVNDRNGKSIVTELEFRKAPFTGFDFSLFTDSAINLYEETKVVLGIE